MILYNNFLQSTAAQSAWVFSNEIDAGTNIPHQFTILVCSDIFPRISNSSEAENPTKNEKMKKLICPWGTVIFATTKFSYM